MHLLRTLFILMLILPCAAQARSLNIVASFSILGDITREVAGKDADIRILVGPAADAHVYEPTPADARAVANANLVIVNGLGFEGWMSRLLESSGYREAVAVAANGVTPLMLNGTPDPHAWQSVANTEIYTRNIRDALIKADPAHADTYRTNAARYIRELQTLDEWVRAQMQTVPPEKRRAIISHDALHYFATRYAVTFLAPRGLTTAAGEPGARDIAQLIDQIRSTHVRAIFVENMGSPRLMETLSRDAGAVIGGTLYSDALSAPDGEAPTYIAMIRHNVNAMTKAMQGN
jgi:zinc/manganese transport system substrate-binding protein